MKILGILGSPHKNGGSAQLLWAALKSASLEGCETELICLYDGEIKSCIGCINDNEPNCKFPCIFDDFGKVILEKIYYSDGIIFATPTYWFGVSSQIKALIERITCLEHMIIYGEQSYMENKVVSAIVVGTDGGVISTVSYLLTVFNAMGAIIPPWAMAYSHQAKKAIYDDKALMDAINVGKITANTIKLIKGHKELIKYKYDKNLLEKIRKEVIKSLGI